MNWVSHDLDAVIYLTAMSTLALAILVVATLVRARADRPKVPTLSRA